MKTLSILILIVVAGCTAQESTEVYEFEGLDNVQVFPSKASLDTLLLTKDKTFGDTKDVLFASMGIFTVDDSGRFYIADGGWGSRSLHVFNPDGSYLKKIAGEGRGPAEFLSLSNLQYHSGRILFYDSQLQRIMMYSTASLKPIKTVLTDPQKWQDMEGISGKRSHEYYLEAGSTVVAAFELPPSIDNAGIRKKQYYRLNTDLKIMSEELAELDAARFVFSNTEKKTGDIVRRAMKHFPFFERHFFIPGKSKNFYTVDSREFLIKKFDSLGNYMSAFYHPYVSPEVSREQALKSANEMTESIAEQVELPKTWPVVNSIFLDDEHRFWIATITESDEYFQWWVLEETGEIIARFKWPGDRYQHPASLKNHVIVKDGYFYQRKEDDKSNQSSIVRYKIEFLQREDEK